MNHVERGFSLLRGVESARLRSDVLHQALKAVEQVLQSSVEPVLTCSVVQFELGILRIALHVFQLNGRHRTAEIYLVLVKFVAKAVSYQSH